VAKAERAEVAKGERSEAAKGERSEAAVVLIYVLRGCPYCVRAKALLDSKAIPYREIDVTADQAERRRLCERTGHWTFPQIFIDDRFIGGCDELVALERRGKLDVLLS
jgi:glutaredoxin 3